MKTRIVLTGLFLSSLTLIGAESALRETPFVAHEWGTFTSVQGADGQLLQWNPLNTSRLPTFVYDRSRFSGDPQLEYGAGKAAMFSLQRMETPVIYFYAEQPFRADVTVEFPKGIITEWYPAAGRIGPAWPRTTSASVPAETNSIIRWPQVTVLPSSDDGSSTKSLPTEVAGSHYYAARDTDANLLEVPERPGQPTQREKFLFYRGVGSFTTPLTVTASGPNAEQLTLSNTGFDTLSSLLVVKVEGGQAAFWRTERLSPNEHQVVNCDWAAQHQPVNQAMANVSQILRQALEAQGLYPREASAMVATWRDAWLEEEGLRVLYLLPRPWTDHTLPLKIEPAPKQLARVMVGRAEIISPRVEEQIRNQVVRFTDADPKVSAQAVEDFRALKLGRFAAPAVQRATAHVTEPQLKDAAWRLLQAAASDAKPKTLAGL